ncbi:hypothetical protein [Oceanirhabdus sp. W0125-5]|uniref:hypothetical protein n=1 Tax=Oceanirhabdus sp. W0125-5 TaxID=2999116 RepID=UPI0022F2FB09|nr:hypothetical protein [Oceanirhabdus sp. W0125-5]WBW99038.1 hypothetical protein OW730_09915 [Oceanirhabdus sp. W0125-5]
MTDNRYGTRKTSNIDVARDDVLKPRRNDRKKKNEAEYRTFAGDPIDKIGKN